MDLHTKALTFALLLSGAGFLTAEPAKKVATARPASVENTNLPRLWREPPDLKRRDLFYGPGGKDRVPAGPFTFLKEDLAGSNPKFDIRDRDGTTWKVKLGNEAPVEVVATRIVWAIGYFTDEDYFVRNLEVADVPTRLHRGQKFLTSDGTFLNARLKRKGSTKERIWKWRSNPFTGTEALNGLRVLMAVINNWDLKDSNNKVYAESGDDGSKENVYLVSDLGASFGSPGLQRTHEKSKNNLLEFRRSHFIKRVTPKYVDFETPRRPAIVVWVNPIEYIQRMRLEWIGRRIPREDARWAGALLARLSQNQIRDAFRAGGFSPEVSDAFSRILEDRIAQLNKL